jgi:type I restriction enzyme, R subunit
MGMSEADTRSKLIDPRLYAAGWDEPRIRREFPYKRGSIRLVGEHPTRDHPQFVDYVLRDEPRGQMLAIVEAKDEDHGPSDGLGQALGYAIDLGVLFAYSSNGKGIVEHDRLTNTVTPLDEFPTREDLLARLQAGDTSRGPRVLNRRGEEVDNPIITPAWPPPGGGEMHWYQERSVLAVLQQMLAGKQRALLSLATGTGKTFIAFNLAWKLIKSGYATRVLFLADRVSLRDQAFNEFGGFGSARGVAGNGEVPLSRDIHFGLYQGLYSRTKDGRRRYEHYPADYFDLVVIDECHRAGYGDWRAILDYLSPRSISG